MSSVEKMTQRQFDRLLVSLGVGGARLDYPCGDGGFIRMCGELVSAGIAMKGVSLSQKYADGECIFYTSYEKSAAFATNVIYPAVELDTVYCRDFVQKLSEDDARTLIDSVVASSFRVIVTAPFDEARPLWNEGNYLGNKIVVDGDACQELLKGFVASVVEVDGKAKLLAMFDRSLACAHQACTFVECRDLVRLASKAWGLSFHQVKHDLKEGLRQVERDLVVVQNRLYAQVEALAWLSRALKISGSLPPLRGWAASPDVLLRLHEHVRFHRPRVVVECGSGASTLVIADALRQNGEGILVSLEHSEKYGGLTRASLEREGLDRWVRLRIGELELWEGKHLNEGAQESVTWYSLASLAGIEDVDLLFIDGPPGSTCRYARYPALPAFFERLAPRAQVWMDDTIRQEEVDICNSWAEEYGYEVEYFRLEKGLGVLLPS